MSELSQDNIGSKEDPKKLFPIYFSHLKDLIIFKEQTIPDTLAHQAGDQSPWSF